MVTRLKTNARDVIIHVKHEWIQTLINAYHVNQTLFSMMVNANHLVQMDTIQIQQEMFALNAVQTV